MAGVKRIGSDELIADLRELARRAPTAAQRGLLRGGEEAVKLAKSYTPERIGRARRSIHVGGHPELSGDFDPGADRGWYGDLGNYGDAGGKDVVGIELGSDLFYFRWLEDGGPHNAAARPIGRAVDDVAPRLEQFIVEEIGKTAEELGL